MSWPQGNPHREEEFRELNNKIDRINKEMKDKFRANDKNESSHDDKNKQSTIIEVENEEMKENCKTENKKNSKLSSRRSPEGSPDIISPKSKLYKIQKGSIGNSSQNFNDDNFNRAITLNSVNESEEDTIKDNTDLKKILNNDTKKKAKVLNLKRCAKKKTHNSILDHSNSVTTATRVNQTSSDQVEIEELVQQFSKLSINENSTPNSVITQSNSAGQSDSKNQPAGVYLGTEESKYEHVQNAKIIESEGKGGLFDLEAQRILYVPNNLNYKIELMPVPNKQEIKGLPNIGNTCFM